MGKRIKRKMAPETTYDGNEVTDFSPRITHKAALTAKTVRRAFKVGKEMAANKWPVLDVESGRVVATLSRRNGQWCYMIKPGNPGHDQKIHLIGTKEATVLACANKVRGYQVTREEKS